MNLTPLLSEHSGLLASWKMGHGQVPVDPAYWPRHGLLALDKENKPLAAAFLFCTDGPLCMVDWVVADPSSAKIERREAVKQLISELYKLGASLGYPLGYGIAGKQSVIDVSLELGFEVEHTNLTGLIKRL